MNAVDYIKFHYNNTSIKNKIFLLNVGIIIVSLTVLAFFANSIYSKEIIDKAVKNSMRELILIDKNLQSMVNSSEDYVRILSTDHRLQKELFNKLKHPSPFQSMEEFDSNIILSQVISEFVEPNAHMVGASVMTPDGDIFDIGFIDNKCVSNEFKEAEVRRIVKAQTPVWTNLFRLKFKYGNVENAFSVAKAVIDKDKGKTTGIVILYLREKDISSVYIDNLGIKGSKFYILDEKQTIISSQNQEDIYRKFEWDGLVGSPRFFDTEDNGSIIAGRGEGKVLLTVHSFSRLGWKIVSVVPLSEITVENRNINRLIIIIGTACIFFAFITSYLLTRTITRPVLKLAGVMKAIRKGDMDVRADFNSRDEIGMLGEGFNSLMDRIEGLMNQINAEQRAKRESDFKLLQSQIKPHFLYNTIETIISFIKLNMKENAISTAKYLAKFYRMSLSKGNDFITVEDEIQLTNSYLSIQKQRYVEYMDYWIDVDDSILQFEVPKLTLQPLVENAIYHGLKQNKEKGNLIIKCGIKQDTLLFEVFDNGVGMSEGKIRKVLNRSCESEVNKDFGVGSVNERIKLLYGDIYGLSIESEVGKYTKVTIALPLIKRKEGGSNA